MAPSSDSSNAAARPTAPLVFGSTGLSSLQQEEQQKLMDEIDRLRSAGVNEFISLPQLVVCGDQSSGKSSVLEAITEIPFPRRANLCTRFATQIMLRRGTVERATVRIIPFSKRSNEEKDRLKNFTGTIESFSDLPGLIDKASEAMGVGGSGGCFARDTLSIEIFGPDKPQLTIVDTPGLIHSETRGQTQADIQMVSDLVHDYMHDPRTIILAVVSARNDIANQVVLHRARTADPSGERTLGIITKPDTAGPEMEGAFVALARNEDIPLTLGWHMLRNRSTEEKEMTFAERNLTEQMFFQQRPWSALSNSDTGIEALRVRLSWLLYSHIQREIPRVRQEILEAYEKAATELTTLGVGRSTPDEQRAYLIDISQKLTDRCRAAVDGNYESSFFAASGQKLWKRHRLRAVVQQDNTAFAELMRTSGHFREIGGTIDPSTVDDITSSLNPVRISKQQAVEWVRPFIEASRGRELSGSYNPLLIRDLFMEQSQRWNEIAQLHVNRVWKRCKIFLKSALNGLAPADVVEGLWQCYLDEAINARLKRANEELEELLMDKSSVITYNHYYTQNVQKNRICAMKKRFDNVAEVTGIEKSGDVVIDGTKFWESVEHALQPNMDDFACEEVLESMLAYYKVALKTFVDNVAVIVIERRILRDLPNIFSPSVVALMSSEQVSDIAEESKWQKEMRERLNATIKSLEQGKDVFERAMRSHHNIRGPQDKKKTDLEESEEYGSDDSDFAESLSKRLSITRGVKQPSAKTFGPVDTPQSTARSTHLDRSSPGVTKNSSSTGDTPTGSVFGRLFASTAQTPGTTTAAQQQPTQITPKPDLGMPGGLFGAPPGTTTTAQPRPTQITPSPGFGLFGGSASTTKAPGTTTTAQQPSTQITPNPSLFSRNPEQDTNPDKNNPQKVSLTSGNAQTPGINKPTGPARPTTDAFPLIFPQQSTKPSHYISGPTTYYISARFTPYKELECGATEESSYASITLLPRYRFWSPEELRLTDYKFLNKCS